ncbi:MAG TPA: hypothetical protein VG838_04685 [Opitutaceae bacterium]|nr:hypothetical protein [Opitutaceae bacterium]
MIPPFRALAALLLLAAGGCARPEKAAPAPAAAARHEHHPPHGGTPVVLGAELYHLEFVLDPAGGRLSAYVLDGEMENFIRSAAPSFEIVATVAGQSRPLVLQAVANPATGETVGDTSLFEGTADWLKTTPAFDAVLSRLDVRGTTFSGVAFNFPKGNDRD